MATAADEHERTMAFADIALGQIRALHQPASPRYFEIWYAYATGYHPSLNRAINELLARAGTLAEAEIDQIYESYISANRLPDRIGHVGSQVMGEIEQVMAMIDAAAGNASSYGESLADVTTRLGSITDGDAIRSIVETLIGATKEMEHNNKLLEARLSSSRDEIIHLRQSLDAARNENLTDPLTSLANRKYFAVELAKAMAHARDRGEPLSLMMADVDHFKKFNDSYSHLIGDQVLRLVAISMKQNLTSVDLAARYGGQEFAVVLPNAGLRSALTIADEVRRAVMTKELVKRSTGENLGHVTVSVGVAALGADDTPQALFERAETCLYTAKKRGRNCVIGESDREIGSTAEPKVA